MFAIAVINADGGSAKSLDVEAYCSRLKKAFAAAGRKIECHTTSGARLIETLEDAARDKQSEALVVCGGDGTVSAAAALAYKHKKTLGILPAGTFNLFARSLRIPLDPEAAIHALATATIENCDLASANGRHFVHQFSAGVQPRLIAERDRTKNYDGRAGKLLSGLQAAASVLMEQQLLEVNIRTPDDVVSEQVAVLTVSNNPYGEDHLPYADRVNRGKLGVYRAGDLTRSEEIVLVADIMRGRWNDNPDLRALACSQVVLEFVDLPSGSQASIDGELLELEDRVELKSHPGALSAMVPTQDHAVDSAL